MTQPTPHQQAENIVAGIKNTYQVVAKRHIHPWYSWAVMAAAIGFTVGVAYVANQNASFSASQASTFTSYEQKLTNGFKLTSTTELRIGTILQPIWMSSTLLGRSWTEDRAFEPIKLAEPTREVLLTLSKETINSIKECKTCTLDMARARTADTAKALVGAESILVVAVVLPNGDLIFSDPVSTDGTTVALDTSRTPAGRLGAGKIKYQFKLLYDDKKGNLTPLNVDDSIFLSSQRFLYAGGYYLASYDGNYYGVDSTNGVVSPAATPIPYYIDFDVPLGSYINDSGESETEKRSVRASGILPPQATDGTYTIKISNPFIELERKYWDSVGSPNVDIDTDAFETAIDAYWAENDSLPVSLFSESGYYIGDLAIDFKSNTAGPVVVPQPPIAPPRPYVSYVRLNATTITPASIQKGYGTRMATFSIDNVAGQYVNLSGASSGDVQLNSFTLTLTTASGDMPQLILRTSTLEKGKEVFSAPVKCKPVNIAGSKSKCRAIFTPKTLIKPGTTASMVILVETTPLEKAKTSLKSIQIEDPKSFQYTYSIKVGPKKSIKTKFFLDAQQVPFTIKR